MTHTRMRTPATPPPRYKLALVTWIGVYPVITLLLAVLGPATATWPVPLRTLLLTAVMVPTLTWLVIPALTRIFRSWLDPSSGPSEDVRALQRQTEGS